MDFSRTITKLNPQINAIDTGETWLKVRPLQVGDYDRGFLELLSQLTGVGNVSRDEFLSIKKSESNLFESFNLNFSNRSFP